MSASVRNAKRLAPRRIAAIEETVHFITDDIRPFGPYFGKKIKGILVLPARRLPLNSNAHLHAEIFRPVRLDHAAPMFSFLIARAKLRIPILGHCALKAKAEVIYTWNATDFPRLSPTVASRMKNPGHQ